MSPPFKKAYRKSCEFVHIFSKKGIDNVLERCIIGLMKALKSSEATTYKKLGVPVGEKEMAALDALKRRGIQKGHWVAEAIREKLERDGLLVKEPQA